MSKTVIALLTAAILAFVTACGSSGGSGSSPAGSTGTSSSGGSAGGSTSAQNNGGGSGSSGGGEKMVLRLGHQSPEKSAYHYLALEFKEIVEEKTNGQVEIEIYPFRQLGADVELMSSMQMGTLDLGVITGSAISNFTPEFMVLDLPYIFEDRQHVLDFLASDGGKELLKETEKADMVTFGLMPRLFRHITNSKRPIHRVEDLKGMTIRVSESEMYLEAYKLLGASVQTMNFGDTMTALQQGAIDGQENTMDVIHDERVYEVQKYVSKTGINFAFAALMGSKQNFESWPADLQQIIVDASAQAIAEIEKLYETYEDDYTKILTDLGLEINDVENKQPFVDLTRPVIDQFVQKYGDKYVKLIEAVK
jgi:tripartite ATP-independent transporter DctP family solute receptor